MNNPVLNAIYHRRSIREFTNQPVTEEHIQEIIHAGIWAPSGLNNQPWRFAIIQDKAIKQQIAKQTKYSKMVLDASVLIAVYLDTEVMYDEVKDHQAAGACIQNMLLAVEALDLGAVWLGQILKNKSHVNAILGISQQFDLMAILLVGHPLHRNQKSNRKDMKEFILTPQEETT